MKTNYGCSICGRKNVKLWRPCMDTEPLICAKCAEERQSPQEYDEVNWKMVGNGHYEGKPTGRKIQLPKWEVDEEGKVPSYRGPGPDGIPREKTDQLIVDLREVSKACSSGETNLVPAVPNEDDDFWSYNSIPEESYQWWEALPTK